MKISISIILLLCSLSVFSQRIGWQDAYNNPYYHNPVKVDQLFFNKHTSLASSSSDTASAYLYNLNDSVLYLFWHGVNYKMAGGGTNTVSIDESNLVHITGDENITGYKTYNATINARAGVNVLSDVTLQDNLGHYKVRLYDAGPAGGVLKVSRGVDSIFTQYPTSSSYQFPGGYQLALQSNPLSGVRVQRYADNNGTFAMRVNNRAANNAGNIDINPILDSLKSTISPGSSIDETTLVHIAGAETITGEKTFAADAFLNPSANIYFKAVSANDETTGLSFFANNFPSLNYGGIGLDAFNNVFKIGNYGNATVNTTTLYGGTETFGLQNGHYTTSLATGAGYVLTDMNGDGSLTMQPSAGGSISTLNQILGNNPVAAGGQSNYFDYPIVADDNGLSFLQNAWQNTLIEVNSQNGISIQDAGSNGTPGVIAADFNARQLYDNAGNVTFDWNTPLIQQFVPYSGAIGDVDLGGHNINAAGANFIDEDGNIITIGFGEMDFSTANHLNTLSVDYNQFYAGKTLSGGQTLRTSLKAEGVRFNNVSTSTRDVISVGGGSSGLVLYNQDTKELNLYDGTQWKAVGGSGAVSGDYNDLTNQPNLALYELLSNKSTATTLGTSNALYPTQNAVKTYVDNAIAGSTSGVTTISNSDGSLTITPTSGNAAASLNTAHPNTWTAEQTIQLPTEQLHLAYDATHYLQTTVGSNGSVVYNLNTSGGTFNFNQNTNIAGNLTASGNVSGAAFYLGSNFVLGTSSGNLYLQAPNTGTGSFILNNAAGTAQNFTVTDPGNATSRSNFTAGGSVSGQDINANAATAPSLFFGSTLNLSRTGTGIASLGNGTRNDATGSLLAGKIGLGTSTLTEVLNVNGYALATGYKIPSGTSSQFLKANGSVDANTYLTSAVTSLSGTANQIIASASTGSVTLSLPQNIATTSNVQFATVTEATSTVTGKHEVGTIRDNTATTYNIGANDYLIYLGANATINLPAAGSYGSNGLSRVLYITTSVGGTLTANGTDTVNYQSTGNSTYTLISGKTYMITAESGGWRVMSF